MNLNRSIAPRRWQAEAVEIWSRDRRGVVRIVTGGGKTVFSYLCLEHFFSTFPDGRAIIVVPTVALLDQWFVDICDATDIDDAQIACYSGISRAENPRRINILVLNTARRMSRQLSETGPTMLVVDECHRSGTQENCRALKGNYQATLGLSATPERALDYGFQKLIEPALGSIIYSYGYTEAKADGIIVDFDLVNIEFSLDNESVRQLPARTIESRNHSDHESVFSNFQILSQIKGKSFYRSAESMLRIPWAIKLALHHHQERIIIFHERVEAVKKIEDFLFKFGHNSVSYHSNLSEGHRRNNLRLFRHGTVNILNTCRALDEGANVPEANVAIVAHSTSSTRQRIQRLGRVLRPTHGKERALVYTLYRDKDQRERLVEESSNLEGVANIFWKRGVVQ